jgi:type II secretory pathway pseudopilin PulG
MRIKDNQGSLLIEVMVSVALLVVFAVAIGSFAAANNRVIASAKMESLAAAFAKESMEQAFAIKEQGWPSIGSVLPGNYIIGQSGNSYVLQSDAGMPPGEKIEGAFTRIVSISKAFRDGSGNLAASGAEDPAVRRIVVTVTWQDHGLTKKVQLASYVTNWKGQ